MSGGLNCSREDAFGLLMNRQPVDYAVDQAGTPLHWTPLTADSALGVFLDSRCIFRAADSGEHVYLAPIEVVRCYFAGEAIEIGYVSNRYEFVWSLIDANTNLGTLKSPAYRFRKALKGGIQ